MPTPTPTPTPKPAPIPSNDSLVTGRIIAVRSATNVLGLPWEIDIEVHDSKDVPGYPSNLTKSQIGKVITALTKYDAPQFDGKDIIASVMWRDDTWGKFFYAEDISLPTDTTPPPAISSLTASGDVDGNVILNWDMSTAEDFDHYNIYISKTMITNVTGIKPVSQSGVIRLNEFQASGLEPTTRYYFAVTAVDKSSNENKLVTSASAIPVIHVTLSVSAVLSVPDDVIKREFTWSYGSIEWEWDSTLSGYLFQTMHNKPRPRTNDYSVYVTYSLDDAPLNFLASSLSAEAEKMGFTDEQEVELALSFVQSIPYSTDIESTGLQEYPRYPIETLVEDTGDCEDHAILLGELLRSLHYDAILLEYPGEHMAVGVAEVGNMYGSYYNYNGKKYFYAETTATGFKVGNVPPGFERAANVWDLVPTPILYCKHWQWPDFTGTMPLELTVANDGTAPALGVTAYAFLDAGNNNCYADASTIIDIPPDETRTVTLMLPLPNQAIQTRAAYRIFLNDFKVDEGFSDWQYFTSGR